MNVREHVHLFVRSIVASSGIECALQCTCALIAHCARATLRFARLHHVRFGPFACALLNLNLPTCVSFCNSGLFYTSSLTTLSPYHMKEVKFFVHCVMEVNISFGRF